MGDRCKGRCCEAFVIIHDMNELRARAENPNNPYQEDDRRIAEMLLPIHPVAVGSIVIGGANVDTNVSAGFVYTCRHFDDSDRNCEAYEARPSMCKTYPNGARCGFASCSWTEAIKPYEKAGQRTHLIVLAPDDVRPRMTKAEAELLDLAAKVRAVARGKMQVL